MGKEYITWNEFVEAASRLKCPRCGNNVFQVSGAKKINIVSTVKIDEKIELLKEEIEGTDWSVVYDIWCSKCGDEIPIDEIPSS